MGQLNYKNLSMIFIIFDIVNICSGKVPSVVKICSRNDPNIEQCIKESIHELRPYLATGDLGDGFTVPSFEPFVYEGFSISPSSNFLVKVTSANLTGGSNFTIEKIKFNYKKLAMDMVLNFPQLKLVGKYDLRAKISIIDITGHGDLESIISNTKMRIKLNGIEYKTDVSRTKFEKVNMRIQAGKAKIQLYNLFNGDPTLQAVGNQLVNENQEIFIEQIVPVMEKQFSKLLLDVGNAITEKATLEELFPENPAFEKHN